jgi:hypothetical protein
MKNTAITVLPYMSLIKQPLSRDAMAGYYNVAIVVENLCRGNVGRVKVENTFTGTKF